MEHFLFGLVIKFPDHCLKLYILDLFSLLVYLLIRSEYHFVNYFSRFSLGSDKVNQARHARIFNSKKALNLHMKKLAKLLKPKFDLVQKKLNSLPEGIATWSKPTGGYFVSFNSLNGNASKIYNLCSEAGLKLTPLGATFPYGKDLDNKNIRLAHTQIELEDLSEAMDLFCLCVL